MTDTMGARLRQLRAKEGSTLDEVAGRSGVSKPHIWALEHDRVPRPSVRSIGALARYYRTTIDWLFEGGEKGTADDLVFCRDYSRMPERVRARVRRLAAIVAEGEA